MSIDREDMLSSAFRRAPVTGRALFYIVITIVAVVAHTVGITSWLEHRSSMAVLRHEEKTLSLAHRDAVGRQEIAELTRAVRANAEAIKENNRILREMLTRSGPRLR